MTLAVVVAIDSSHTSRTKRAPVAGTVVSGTDTIAAVARVGPTSFVNAGPFGVGETTLRLSYDGAPVEVWYPATPASVRGRPSQTYDVAHWLPQSLKRLLPLGSAVTFPSGGVRGVAVSSGRFPLVVFCHGYSGFRDQSTFLTSRLASWGFIVAAPDLLDYDLTAVLSGKVAPSSSADIAEVKSTLALMSKENSAPRSRFSTHLDMSKVAVIGHSLGGSLAEEVASVDPQVRTFIGMAGASVGALAAKSAGPVGTPAAEPGMLMVGTADHVVKPALILRAFDAMSPPKRLVTLKGAGHLAFSDICLLGSGQGGLLGIAERVHITIPPQLVPLASDGCQPEDLPIKVGWQVIRQAVTAQLRYALGFDHTQAGFNGLGHAFKGAVASDTFVP